MTAQMRKVEQAIEKLNKAYETNMQLYPIKYEGEIEEFEQVVKNLLDKEKSNSIALDITAGRKYMSALFLKLGLENHSVKSIYYTHIPSYNYQNTPLPLIPQPFYKVSDLKEKVK